MRQTTQTDNPGNYVCHVNGQRTYWKRGADCAAGETWNSTTKTCVPDGPTDEECQAINAEPGFLNVGPTSRSFESRCMANGCIFAAVGPRITVSDPTGISVTNGTFEWTGACASPPEPDAMTKADAEAVPDQVCTTEGQGDLKLCIKKTGEHCLSYPAGTGKQQCWKPGETGEKTDGAFLQKRNGGTTAEPPTNPNLTPVGNPKTTTAVKQPENTTITTTVTNYKTTDGTDAGDSNDGEPDDGTGGTDDEQQDGSVTDDGTCEQQPQVSGGDPLLANIILQTWGARCAQLDDNAITTTEGAIDDCTTPWAITGGSDVNVAKLKALRKSICPFADDASAGKGAGDYGVDGVTNANGEEAAAQASISGTVHSFGADGLDDSGFGYTRTCPQLPVIEVMGTSIDFNVPEFCDWIKLGGQFVLIIAALVSLRIIAGGAA